MHSAWARYARGDVPFGAQLVSIVWIEMQGGIGWPVCTGGEQTLFKYDGESARTVNHMAERRRADEIMMADVLLSRERKRLVTSRTRKMRQEKSSLRY
jgi:hypothetical protein